MWCINWCSVFLCATVGESVFCVPRRYSDVDFISVNTQHQQNEIPHISHHTSCILFLPRYVLVYFSCENHFNICTRAKMYQHFVSIPFHFHVGHMGIVIVSFSTIIAEIMQHNILIKLNKLTQFHSNKKCICKFAWVTINIIVCACSMQIFMCFFLVFCSFLFAQYWWA